MSDFNATLKAAEQGDAEAQSHLGLMYDQGRGGAQDDAQARAWFQKAAERGVARAQFKLGLMSARGEDDRKDMVQAYKWGALSAQKGVKNGATLRDFVAKEMTPAELAEAERLVAEWYQKADGAVQEGAAPQ